MPLHDARWSAALWREEVGLDIHLLLSGNNIPLTEMGNHCLDLLVLVP